MEAAVTGNEEDTYDAYEKDIAFATFYFEEPTVFEYTRHVKESTIIAKELATYCFSHIHREARMTTVDYLSQVSVSYYTKREIK